MEYWVRFRRYLREKKVLLVVMRRVSGVGGVLEQ